MSREEDSLKPGRPLSPVARLRETIQALIDRLRGGRRQELRRRLSAIEELIVADDWNTAIAETRTAAAIAKDAGHLGMLSEFGRLLEQMGDYEAAAPIRYAGERRKHRPKKPVWSGEDIGTRTLLVEQVFNHLGQQLRHARLIAPAAESARRCIVLAERRLVPLFARTFPGADVRDQAADHAEALDEADLVTNAWDLAERFANSEAKIAAGFIPLQPSQPAVEELRAKYRSDARGPLIGISWGTSNSEREVAELAHWAGILSDPEPTFVSLQYGAVEPALGFLAQYVRNPIVNDPSIDQLIDMDRFCAQVSALDMVITIDNTIAHAAGALGKRCVVITDDGPSHWPLRGNRTPWYPATIVVRRRGREWRQVFDEAWERARGELGEARGD